MMSLSVIVAHIINYVSKDLSGEVEGCTNVYSWDLSGVSIGNCSNDVETKQATKLVQLAYQLLFLVAIHYYEVLGKKIVAMMVNKFESSVRIIQLGINTSYSNSNLCTV